MAKKKQETRFLGVQNFPEDLREKISAKAKEDKRTFGVYLIMALQKVFK